jgi:tetratricopeptide (TPR) repeat protein
MTDKQEHKMSRKELKAPDEFQKLGAQAMPFMVTHQKTIVGAVVALVAIGGIVALVSHFGAKDQQTATNDFASTLKVLKRPVNANPTPPKEGAEDASADEAPFKTEAEKDEAVVKALTDFRSKAKGTRAAANAALPLGQALLRQDKAPEALEAFEEYLKSSDPTDPLRPTALEGKGYAYEQKKEYDQALAAFDQLAKENKSDFMKGMGLYHRGRVLLLQGKSEEGAKQLVEVPNVAPATAAARLATDRVALLVSQGVKVPQATPPAPAQDGG